jgi:hypothetical protein
MERNEVVEILDAGNEGTFSSDPEVFCCVFALAFFTP